MNDDIKLQELFIARTVAANNAKGELERLSLSAERHGILDAIQCLYGASYAGECILMADQYYIDRGVNRNMVGGLWLDWEASNAHSE